MIHFKNHAANPFYLGYHQTFSFIVDFSEFEHGKFFGGVRAKCFLCQKVDSRIKLIPHWVTWDVLCTKTPLRRQIVWERYIPCKCTHKLPSKRRILPLQTPTYFKMLKNMSNWIYKKEKVLIRCQGKEVIFKN